MQFFRAPYKRFLVSAVIAIVAASSLIYVYLDGQENVKANSSVDQITNVAANSYAEQIIADCGIRPHCAMEALQDISKREEQTVVLRTFDYIISKYDESSNYCHHEAHHLGMFLYAYTGNLTQALFHADQKCGAAVYHGVMINYLLTQKVLSKIKMEEINIKEICPTNAKNSYALEKWQCLHGLGHGLMASYDYDVFAAVQRCGEFELRWEQLSCSKGVFMENVVRYYETKSGAFDKNDILFPCNAIGAKYAPACYHYHTSYIMIQKSFSVDEGFKECDKIIPEDFVKYCYYGMGRDMSVSVFDDMELSLTICQTGQLNYQSYCFKGMAMTLVNNRGTNQAFEFCNILPEQFKVDCYDGMGKWARMLHSTDEERAEECSKAEGSKYFEVCMNANLEDLTLL